MDALSETHDIASTLHAQLSHQDRIGTFQDGFFPPALDGSFGDLERIGDSLVSPRRPKFSLVALEQRFGTGDFP